MYNLEVYQVHNYSVSEVGVLVHNSYFDDAIRDVFDTPRRRNHFLHGSKNSKHQWELLVPDLDTEKV